MPDSSSIRRVALLCLHTSPLSLPGSGTAGGMNLYVRRLAEDLSRMGVRVDVFTRRSDPDSPECVPLSTGARVIHLDAGPARTVPKSVVPLHIPAMVASLRAFVERNHVAYDALHSHYWLSGVVALRFRDDPRVPVLHMFHTLSRAKEVHSGRLDPNDSGLRYDAERCVAASADVIVGATDVEAEVLQTLYGKRPQRYEVIPPGVDLEVFAPKDKDTARASLGIKAEKVIVFAGRLAPIKGLDILLRAVGSIRGSIPGRLSVVVVGGCDEIESPGMGYYRTMARESGIDRLVQFRGQVPQADLPLYFSAADVCAMPSAYETFGMVALEAMACQTPVVAFGVGGLPATIRDGQTGFLAAAGSTSSFAEALRLALTSEKLETIGRRARLVAQRFTWPAAAESTLDLYEQAAFARFARYERTSSAC